MYLNHGSQRAVHRSVLCRSRRELSTAYLVAKIGFDRAENEPRKVCPLFVYRSPKFLGKPASLREFADVSLSFSSICFFLSPQGPTGRRFHFSLTDIVDSVTAALAVFDSFSVSERNYLMNDSSAIRPGTRGYPKSGNSFYFGTLSTPSC